MVETDIMNWNLCEKRFIRKVEVDEERVNLIKKKALQRLERARTTKITLENVSFVVEDYYEVIKELLVVCLLTNGLRSQNYQFLISQMSFFRNRLGYCGEDIPIEFYQKNKNEFENIINIILKLITKANE